MITFSTHRFPNGLRLVHHHDTTTRMVAVNLLYDVGSSDEHPAKTGLAHLMEHLMFSGTRHVPSYDGALQAAGGESNAWTSIDVTNYYDILPAHNLETALWLESERLINLALNEENIEVQKSVVIEEFKQRYLNQPYGDILHLQHGLAYKEHPYRWPTIGLSVDTIKNFTRDDVLDFHRKHYAVNNIVMCISGNVDFDTTVRLVEKWFGDIESRPIAGRRLPAEPPQGQYRFMSHKSDVPSNMIFTSYHMCGRTDSHYQATDLLSDVLGNGMSSRFYRELILGSDMFVDVDASVLGSRDPGLFYVRARLSQGASLDRAAELIDGVIERVKTDITQHEIDKCVNKYISNKLFENVGYAEKAVALARHELLWGASNINDENEVYRRLTPHDLMQVANTIFSQDNCCRIYYGPDA